MRKWRKMIQQSHHDTNPQNRQCVWVAANDELLQYNSNLNSVAKKSEKLKISNEGFHLIVSHIEDEIDKNKIYGTCVLVLVS